MTTEPNRRRDPPRIEGSAPLNVATVLLGIFLASLALGALAAMEWILTATVYDIMIGAVLGVCFGGVLGMGQRS